MTDLFAKYQITPPGADPRRQFLDRIGSLSETIGPEYGFHPTTARDVAYQAALESRFGESLGGQAGSLFGVKQHRPEDGPAVTLPTREEYNGQSVMEDAPFLSYDSEEDAVRGYYEFLRRNPRYKGALEAAASGDSDAYFQALQDAGYATDSQYAEKIRSVRDRYAPQAPAQADGGGGRDLFALLGVDAGPTLGERGLAGLKQGFRSTLAGTVVMDHQIGENERRHADAQARLVEHGRAMGLERAPTYPELMEHLQGNVDSDLQYAAELWGAHPLAQIEQEQATLATKGEQKRAENLPRLQAERQAYEQMRPSWEEDGLLNRAAHMGVAGIAHLAGAIPSPENLVPVGRAGSALGTFAQGAAVNAGVNVAVDPVVQAKEQELGMRDAYSPTDTAISALLGGVIGGSFNVAPQVLSGLRGLLGRQLRKAPEQVTVEDVQGMSPEEARRIVESAQAEGLVDADTLASLLGTDRPGPLRGREARTERRQELADVFGPGEDAPGKIQPTVARREALTPEGELDPNIPPAESRSGTYAGPERLANERLAETALVRAGIDPTPENVQVAAEYVARGLSPDEAAGVFRTAERQARRRETAPDRREWFGEEPQTQREVTLAERRDAAAEDAFRLADARRARREADLADGTREPASDHRPGREPAERIPTREHVFLDLAPDGRGGSTGFQVEQVLASRPAYGEVPAQTRVRYTTPEGEVRTEWVNDSRLTRTQTPENPRIAQQQAAETQVPGKGVGFEQGDAPPLARGPDDPAPSQAPAPRRAADRISDPDGLRRGQWEAGDTPEPIPPERRAHGPVEDAVEVDAPPVREAAEVPQAEVPQADAPRALDAPKAEAPKAEAPKPKPKPKAEAAPKKAKPKAEAAKDSDAAVEAAVREVLAERGHTGPIQGTLFSNPFHLVVQSVASLFGGRKGEWAREVGEAASFVLDVARFLGLKPGAERNALERSALVSIFRQLATVDGNLRMLVAKSSSPTLKAVADLFHARAGQGKGAAATLDERVSSRTNRRSLEIERIMKVVNTHQLDHAEIIRRVENPKLVRQGRVGEVADMIEKFLAEEHAYLTEAGVELGKVRDYFPRVFDKGKVTRSAKSFLAAARRAYIADGVRPEEADLKAQALYDALLHGDHAKPGEGRGRGSRPDFMKGRVFSDKAAKQLEEFYTRDIDHVLMNYVNGATRRAEIARTSITTADGTRLAVGDNWAGWEAIERAIGAEDAEARSLLPELRNLVGISAGIPMHNAGSATITASSWVRTLTTLALLNKAAVVSFGELLIAPMRATTGNLAWDGAQVLKNIGHHTINSLESLGRSYARMGRSERMQAMFDFVEDLGVIGGVGHQSIQAARFAAGDPSGRIQAKAMAQFFKRNGLEELTNYTRATSARVSQVFMRRLAQQMGQKGQRSAFYLRELGIPEGQESAFAAFVKGFGKELPRADQLTGEMGALYRTAVQRFVDQTVQRPSTSTRPAYAAHPLGAVAFQIQSFTYAFQKNVLNRPAGILKSDDLSLLDKAGFLAGYATTLPLMVALNYVLGELRDDLTGAVSGERPQRTDANKLEMALSRTGLFGVGDMPYQLATGTRYQRSMAQSLLGPGAGGILDAGDAALTMMFRNSESTDTAERNMAKKLYNFGVEPALNFALTAVPHARPLKTALRATTTVGIPAGRSLAEDLAGEKNPKAVQKPYEGLYDMMFPPPKPTKPPPRQRRTTDRRRETRSRR